MRNEKAQFKHEIVIRNVTGRKDMHVADSNGSWLLTRREFYADCCRILGVYAEDWWWEQDHHGDLHVYSDDMDRLIEFKVTWG